MNKIFKLYISIFTTALCMLSIGIYSINAEDYYTYSCGNDYEVSYITDDGKFQKHACYADFSSANKEMKKLGDDYVVRHNSSYSPSKIISMNSGLAYSYPARSGQPTMKIYQHVDDRGVEYKNTYIANHYEMKYYNTDRYFKSGVGMVKVCINGFEGYTDLEYTDLVPSKFIEKGLVIYLGGNDITSENEQPYKVICRRNYFEVNENNGINELTFVYHRSYSKPDNVNKYDEEHRIVLGPASEEMVVGAKYYSDNGYEFYNNIDLSDEPIIYYPYYQFLPIRSKTNYTAEEIDEAFKEIKGDINSVIKNHADYFIESQDKYGVNALLLYAMAAHESNWGTSNLALKYNNLFGWNAIDADPSQASKFNSVKDGIFEQAGFNLRKYADIDNPLFFSSSLGNKGSGFNVKYASDPYWGMKIGSIAYRIDKVISGKDLKDFDNYDLALVTKFDAEFKSEADSDSKTMYRGQYGPYYQENLIVIALEKMDDFTKVQSTNPIKDNALLTIANHPNQVVEYDFENSIVYVLSEDLLPLNYIFEIGNTPSGEYISKITDFSWDDTYIYIVGEAYTPGIVVNENNTVKTTLDISNGSEHNEFNLSTHVNDDGVVSFKGSVKIEDLKVGKYKFNISTEYSKYIEGNNSFVVNNVDLPLSKVIGDKRFYFTMNNGELILNVEKDLNDKQKSTFSLDNMQLSKDGILSISGKAFVSGVNYEDKDAIKHELVIISQVDGSEINRYLLETVDSNGFSLNDGFNYKYVSFNGDVDLTEFSDGNYRFVVEVSNQHYELVKQINLVSTNVKNSFNYITLNNVSYKLVTNALYNYRLELDIEPEAFDYGKINKPSRRDSFISYTNLELNNKDIILNGYGFMYYADFGKDNDVSFNVSLLSKEGNVINMDIVDYACPFDYTKIFNSKRNLDNICFGVKYNLSTIDIGEYEIVIELETTNDDVKYYDIVELKNRQKPEFNEVEIDNKIYDLVVSDDRSIIKLVVLEKE